MNFNVKLNIEKKRDTKNIEPVIYDYMKSPVHDFDLNDEVVLEKLKQQIKSINEDSKRIYPVVNEDDDRTIRSIKYAEKLNEYFLCNLDRYNNLLVTIATDNFRVMRNVYGCHVVIDNLLTNPSEV